MLHSASVYSTIEGEKTTLIYGQIQHRVQVVQHQCRTFTKLYSSSLRRGGIVSEDATSSDWEEGGSKTLSKDLQNLCRPEAASPLSPTALGVILC